MVFLEKESVQIANWLLIAENIQWCLIVPHRVSNGVANVPPTLTSKSSWNPCSCAHLEITIHWQTILGRVFPFLNLVTHSVLVSFPRRPVPLSRPLALYSVSATRTPLQLLVWFGLPSSTGANLCLCLYSLRLHIVCPVSYLSISLSFSCGYIIILCMSGCWFGGFIIIFLRAFQGEILSRVRCALEEGHHSFGRAIKITKNSFLCVSL